MRLKLEDLSTEQKLGMLMCARRCRQADDMAYTLELIRNHSLGSVQVPCDKNTPEYIRAIREAADYPILIIADMEQGYPRSNLPKLPAMTLAVCDNPDYYRAFAKCIVAEAKADGYSGMWGPVEDILRVNGPGIVQRSYGDTPEGVIRACGAINEVLDEYGFFSTGKHYPGGHDCGMDTHMVEGFSNVTEEELINFDLVPYIDMMKRGLLPSIMVGHHTYVNIDPEYPASLSRKVIDIIRRLGFNGVCFTDSLAMMGILQKYGEENVMGMCIAAGNDIVLPNYRTSTKTCFEYLKQNYRDGAFDEERLNSAVARVLALQEYVAEKQSAIPVITEEDRKCLDAVARDCITAVTADGVKPCLDDVNKKRLFVVVVPSGFDADAPKEEIHSEKWYFPKDIAAKIQQEFPGAEIAFVPEFAAVRDNESVLTKATKHDEVIFVTFCVTSAYLGTDCMTRRTEALINALIHSGKVSTIVHFGNPFAVKPLMKVPRLLFGYTSTPSQSYAIDVLAGKLPARGKLPFDIGL